MAQRPRNHWALWAFGAPSWPKIAKFPVNFPVSREFRSGDGFDYDCVRHHAFKDMNTFPGLCDFRRGNGLFSSGESLSVAAFTESGEIGRFVSDAQNYVSPIIKLQSTRDGFEFYEVEQFSISN